MITQIIQNNFSNITEDELSLSFWSNPSKIERFCNGILKYFGETNKTVSVEYLRTPYPKVSKSNTSNQEALEVYNIALPEFNLLGSSDLDKAKFSLLSSIFLKHELAHVLFSDFSSSGIRYNQSAIDNIEDARVEYHYSNRLKGNRRNFLLLNYFFYKQERKNIENNSFNQDDLSKYIRYSMSGIRFWNKTEAIQSYDKIYKDNIDNLYTEKYKEVYHNLFGFFKEEKDFFAGIETVSYFKEGSVEFSNIDSSSDIAKEALEYQPYTQKSIPAYKEIEEADNEDYIEEDLFGDDNEDLELFHSILDEELKNALNERYDVNRLYDAFYKKIKDKSLGLDFNISPYDIKDTLHMNLIKFFGYFMGFGFNQKKGLSLYKQVVNNNKKVINESVRFLNLKLQNKERIKYKRFLKEGELDTENIHNIIIEKQDPKVFQRKIQQINPKSSIHILMDISGSMRHEQIEMCLINTIILYEICKKVGIKFSFQMFTSSPSKNFIVRKRKNPILLKHVTHLFKNQERNVYINGIDYRQSTNLSLIKDKERLNQPFNGVSFVGGNAMVYYLKNINEEPSFIFERALGILFGSVKKIRSLSGGTPEFESLAQTIKLHHNDKNKNKMLFLINDGNYDSSFARNIWVYKDTEIYKISSHLGQLGDQALNSMLDKKITNVMNFLTFMGKMETKKDFFEITKNILNKLLRIKEEGSLRKLLNDANESNQDYYYLYEGEDDRDYINFIHSSFDDSLITYRSFIKTLRNSGWKIFGGGIRSNYGIKYIGEENFAYFTDAEDIKQNFGKKLRNYF